MKTLVLITAFNVEKFLEDVVKRIPKEIKSYNPEILIINDFSSDNTLQKMSEIRIILVTLKLHVYQTRLI